MNGPHPYFGLVCSEHLCLSSRRNGRNDLGLGEMVEACTAADPDFGPVSDWLYARHSIWFAGGLDGAVRTCNRRLWLLRPVADDHLQMGSIALPIKFRVWSQRCMATGPLCVGTLLFVVFGPSCFGSLRR